MAAMSPGQGFCHVSSQMAASPGLGFGGSRSAISSSRRLPGDSPSDMAVSSGRAASGATTASTTASMTAPSAARMTLVYDDHVLLSSSWGLPGCGGRVLTHGGRSAPCLCCRALVGRDWRAMALDRPWTGPWTGVLRGAGFAASDVVERARIEFPAASTAASAPARDSHRGRNAHCRS